MSHRPISMKLPLKYADVTREKLPPKPTKGATGRPFFMSQEGFAVMYRDGKFVVDRNSCVHDRTATRDRIPNITPLEIGEKGYCCVGCEPGSWPQPVIIAHVDNENGIVGLIHPFVFIVNTVDTDEEMYVDVKVGTDMAKHANFDMPYEEALFTFEEQPEVYNQSDQYEIWYIDEKHARSVASCLTVGTFGNIDLPHQFNNTIPYNFV